MRYHLTDIKGILRYHSSATHAAEPLYQRTIVLAVPHLRYEKSDNVNQRYQNTATGGTKSPILSAKKGKGNPRGEWGLPFSVCLF